MPSRDQIQMLRARIQRALASIPVAAAARAAAAAAAPAAAGAARRSYLRGPLEGLQQDMLDRGVPLGFDIDYILRQAAAQPSIYEKVCRDMQMREIDRDTQMQLQRNTDSESKIQKHPFRAQQLQTICKQSKLATIE